MNNDNKVHHKNNGRCSSEINYEISKSFIK